MEYHHISNKEITIEEVIAIVESGKALKLSDESAKAIAHCREFLNNYIEKSEAPVYGINTGFGSLCDTTISPKDLSQLQSNLVMSHACGTGNEVPLEVIKIMLFLKIQGLSYGHSGVQLKTVNRLIDFYNADALPVVYTQGSLGASGDLAPLAHLSLPLLGMGEFHYKGEIVEAAEVLKANSWDVITLQSKEGLALLNGTQFMSAYGVYCVNWSKKLWNKANTIMALSMEGFDARIEPFSDLPHLVRKQPGQLKVARAIRELTKGSEIISRNKEHVQDPYSFRCVPQVHGATNDAIEFIEKVVTNEINSVTDNPTIFPEQNQIISAGNFHGQPLALAYDQLAIAMAEMGSISERRVYKLISGTRGLPAFLVANPGLNSGFMIPQYTAASIVSRNKSLCMPSSVDTIDSSNGQEDHVSMGANAAVKMFDVVQNTERVLGIELFAGTQALEFRRPAKSSIFLEEINSNFRKVVPFVKNDEVMYTQIEKSIQFVKNMC
ncbi:MAG: histidine ammonia-lyase [Salibacteraceae bacterium]